MESTSGDDLPLDARIEVVTPENIAVHYRVSGPVRRALALFLDLLIFGALVTVLSIFISMLGFISGGFAMGVMFVVNFLLYWFFFGFQEAYCGGRTLGKRVLNLRVITIDGQPINGLQAIMRNFLRVPSFAFPVIDLLTMSLSDRFQRLGDLVCGTIVIVEDRHWLMGVAKIEDPRAIQLAAYLPNNFEISKSMAKAISTYVERRKFFSTPRKREVARHIAEPVLKKLGFPADTSYDLLLCSLYYRFFIADRAEDEQQHAALVSQATQQPFFNNAQPPAIFPNGGANTGIAFTSPVMTPPQTGGQ